jgi:hypothetical protein
MSTSRARHRRARHRTRALAELENAAYVFARVTLVRDVGDGTFFFGFARDVSDGKTSYYFQRPCWGASGAGGGVSGGGGAARSVYVGPLEFVRNGFKPKRGQLVYGAWEEHRKGRRLKWFVDGGDLRRFVIGLRCGFGRRYRAPKRDDVRRVLAVLWGRDDSKSSLSDDETKQLCYFCASYDLYQDLMKSNDGADERLRQKIRELHAT